MPWKATLTIEEKISCTGTPSVHRAPPHYGERGGLTPLLALLQLLPRILQRGRDRFQLDVGELTVHATHLAQIFVLHDVARRGIDGDRAARTVRVFVLLEQLHGLVRIDLPLLLADHVEDRVHAVPA